MKKNLLIILTASLGLAAATAKPTTTIFATNPTGDWLPGGTWDFTFGTPFTVGGSAVTITSLGYFDQNQDGLLSPHAVGIYNQAQALLGSVTVQAGTASPLRDGTRWEALGSPILLVPGTYMLAGTIAATGDQANISTPAQVTLGSGFTLAGTGFTAAIGAPLQYPGIVLGTGNYAFGANMEAGTPDPVPEPSQWAMMGMTLLGAGVWAARQRRAKANVG